MKWGTCYFVGIKQALRYYDKQGDGDKTVQQKLNEKSIFFGPPKVIEGQKLSIDSDGRYWIEETN